MSNTEALPPLPEPPTPAEWLHHMYSADQMRAYALAALAQPKTIAEWWAAKQAASGEPSSVSPKAQTEFMQALHGEKGALDAWLECYDETEVRAHVLALVHQPAASGEPVAWVRHDWSGTGQRSVSFDAPPDPKPVRDEVVNPIWTPLYAAPQPAASGAQADLIAGALYDLMGDLTSRDETIRLGATEWATPAADALVAFAAKRGLSLDNPAIADWSKRIAAAAQPVPARVPLTDEQVFGSDAIMEVNAHAGLPMRWLMELTRAIEATHGITPAKEAP